VFQSVLLIGGGLLVFFLGLFEVPGGIKTIVGEGSRSHLILPASDPYIPWTALIVLALSTNLWYYCTNQTINQSALGARNEWHARMGIIFAGFLCVLIAFADVFPGLVAYVLDPAIVPDSAYPFVINRLVPAGLRGIVFAGLCGAIISTIEALINASSTIFTFDVYQRFLKKDASHKELILTGRICGAVVLLFSALWAPMVLKFGHIFSYFQECWAFMAVPVAVVFVAGVMWKRVTGTVAFWTLCLSFPMLVLPYLLRIFKVQMNVFNIAGIVLIITIAFIIIFTLLKNKRGTKESDIIWNPRMSRLPQDTRGLNSPWYRNLTFWSIVMIAVYLVIYIVWW
jgi:SSS family solute:Na+ symporter